MVKKGGLGRGLGALIPGLSLEEDKQNDPTPPAEKKEVQERKSAQTKAVKDKTKKGEKEEKPSVPKTGSKREEKGDRTSPTGIKTFGHLLPLEEIEANPDQPRKAFDQEALEELADSIKKYGILQPLLVAKHTAPGRAPYEIVAGERRFRAAKLAGLKEVPVLIREENVEEAALLSVVENVQREDLNPLEEAQAYRTLMETYTLTQQKLADALGKSRAYVANTTRLLQLDDASLAALQEGRLTSSQARTLLGEKDLKKRERLRHLFMEGKTNVNKEEKRKQQKKNKNIYLIDLEDRLSQTLGRQVQIIKRRKGWDLQVSCYSDEDLDQLTMSILQGGDQ